MKRAAANICIIFLALVLVTQIYVPASAETDIWETVWNEQEKLNFRSTPMFLVAARK